MIIVTAGDKYLDIDSYAGMIAYAQLMCLLGHDAQAASSATLNSSITPSLRSLPDRIHRDHQPDAHDTYVLVDISDPGHIDRIVSIPKVREVFDHHWGFKDYWQEKLNDGCHIEPVGAAATLIFEQWVRAGKQDQISESSARLMTAAILDNTLNFGAEMTTSRDKAAYRFLAARSSVGTDWPAVYFSECQEAILADLAGSLYNDIKLLDEASLPTKLCIGQLVVWDAQPYMTKYLPVIANTLSQVCPTWFMNLVSISQQRSYLISKDQFLQRWLHELFGVSFSGPIAQADRMWLRKEILKVVRDHPETTKFG